MLNSSSSPKNRTTVRSKNAVRLTKAALQTAFVVSDNLGASLAERLFTTPRRHARPEREHIRDRRPRDHLALWQAEVGRHQMIHDQQRSPQAAQDQAGGAEPSRRLEGEVVRKGLVVGWTADRRAGRARIDEPGLAHVVYLGAEDVSISRVVACSAMAAAP